MKPRLTKHEMAQFHLICDRNNVRQGRGEWIGSLEKIIADAAFDSLPGEDGQGTVTLSQRTTDRLGAWTAGLVFEGERADIETAICDLVMAAVVGQIKSGLTGRRFAWPTSYHERKMRNATSSTRADYLAGKHRRKGKRE